jgi:hypothetical protein
VCARAVIKRMIAAALRPKLNRLRRSVNSTAYRRTLAAVVVGAGPAGIAPLVAARRKGMLDALLSGGIKIIERAPALGSGQIGNYVVRSDSFADSFLKAIDLDDTTLNLRALLDTRAGRYLDAQRGKPVSLAVVGCFLAEMASAIRESLSARGQDPFVTGVEAFRADRQLDGSWVTRCRNPDGSTDAFNSRNIVIATGADEPSRRLYAEKVAGRPLLPRFIAKTIQSSMFLGSQAEQKLEALTSIHPIRKVAIVGGSHSAIASAFKCMHHPHTGLLDCQLITVLHRNPLRLTYASPEAAVTDGYTAFDPADICPKTGRVFPLAGFRSDSRDLLRQYWGLGGLKRDSRLHVLQLDEAVYTQANQVLEEADLVIAALGYRPRALPLFDHRGDQLPLHCEIGTNPMVDNKSRILDSTGRVIRGAFGIGLSAGYPLAGTHGESSFRGEANGLALWQTEIGEALVIALLEDASTQDAEPTRGRPACG